MGSKWFWLVVEFIYKQLLHHEVFITVLLRGNKDLHFSEISLVKKMQSRSALWPWESDSYPDRAMQYQSLGYAEDASEWDIHQIAIFDTTQSK